MPTDEVYSHIRRLYITTKFNRQLVFRILVNNRVTLNVLPSSMLRKLGKKKSSMLPTNLIITNFCGIIAQCLGVISIKLTVDHYTTKTTFFIIDATNTYIALLGWDWIHASRSISLSLYQYLII